MNKSFLFCLLFFFAFSSSEAQLLPKVKIIISSDSIKLLEANPFTAPDVHGTFIGDTGRVALPQQFDSIELNYRGAYALYGMIKDGSNTLKRRNWKVKMPKTNMYMNRRELNLNYQNHVKEFMTYYLMREAKVPLAENRFVLLSVNGVSHGLYMQIVDVDDKNFLMSAFGNKSGDLYKSAYDTPADPENRYWADFSYLGSNDSDYFMHYDKKTNNDSVNASNYSSIRKFTEMLNMTPDESIEDSIKKNFAWENFIHYLIVGNFVSNWDGYPQRPKNSWMYQNPADGKWNFVPWDLDATFSYWWYGTYPNNIQMNMMGPTCSIFHYMDKYEPYQPGSPDETKERPLVWRMMKVPFFRNYYVQEYKKAINTYLSKAKIISVLDSVSAVIKLNPLADWNAFNGSVSETKLFLNARYPSVSNQLSVFPNALPLFKANQIDFKVYPIPAKDYFTLELNTDYAINLKIDLLDITGKIIRTIYQQPVPQASLSLNINTADLQAGNYFVRMTNSKGVQVGKLIIVK